jgi:hypothetical protein
VLNGEDFSRRSDVYSLGSTLFTLLWGRPPFLHADDELFLPILVRVASQPPPDLRSRGVPEPVCRALERAMAKQPGDRPASALDLAADLAQAEAAHGLAPTVPLVVGLGTGPPGPGPAGPATRTSPPAIATATATTPAPPRARRGRRPVLVGVVLLLAVAAAATVFAQRDPPTSPTRLGADADTTTSGASTTATSSTVPVAAVPFPSTSGTLPAGRYVATRFGAPFQFDLPEGWRAPSPDDQDQLELIRATGDGDSALTFVQPGRVFDPQLAPTTAAETRGAVRSAPVDLVQWIRSHPRLAAGDALPVTKGSLPGTALDVRPTVGYLHDDCLAARPGRRCVLLFVNEDGAFYSLAEGFRARFHLLRVGDQTLVAAIEAPAAQFDAFAPVAEQVLATLGRRP